jgi:hypothetical protein
MTESTEELTSRPAELVPVAVGAFEEVWRSRDYSLTLLSVLSSSARGEAEPPAEGSAVRCRTHVLLLPAQRTQKGGSPVRTTTEVRENPAAEDAIGLGCGDDTPYR